MRKITAIISLLLCTASFVASIITCDNNLVYHSFFRKCITQDKCITPYVFDYNMKVCAVSCRKVTMDLPASILQNKVCVDCPAETPFVDASQSSCVSCTGPGLVKNYKTGICDVGIIQTDLRNGYLSLDMTTIYTESVGCPKDFTVSKYWGPSSLNEDYIKWCVKCPSTMPIAQADRTCSMTCPEGMIADGKQGKCVKKADCSTFFYPDNSYCSSVCQSLDGTPFGEGDIVDGYQTCSKCPADKPLIENGKCTAACSTQDLLIKYNDLQPLLKSCVPLSECTPDYGVVSEDGKECTTKCKQYYAAVDDIGNAKQCNKDRGQCTDQHTYPSMPPLYCSSCSEEGTILYLPEYRCVTYDYCIQKKALYIVNNHRSIINCSDTCPDGFYVKDTQQIGMKICESVCLTTDRNVEYYSYLNSENEQICTQEKYIPAEYIVKDDSALKYYKNGQPCTSGILDSDGKSCVNYCKKTKQTPVQKDGYQQCEKCQFAIVNGVCVPSCLDSQVLDQTSGACYDSADQCSNFLSPDSKTCYSTLPISFISQLVTDKKYAAAVQCPENQPYTNNNSCFESCTSDQYISEAHKKCFDTPSQCTDSVLGVIDKTCVDICPIKTIITVSEQLQAILCAKCDDKNDYIEVHQTRVLALEYCYGSCLPTFITDTTNHLCYEAPTCTTFISKQDYTTCLDHCDASYFIYEKNDGFTFRLCDNKCDDGFKYTDLQGVKNCLKACPKNTITNSFDKVCYDTASECKQFLNSDGKQCIQKCDTDNKEYAKFVKSLNVQQCFQCTKIYYFDGNQNAICDTKCPDDSYYWRDDNTCRIKTVQKCKDSKMSSDQQVCSKNCFQPDIESKGLCVVPKCEVESEDCLPCQDNEILKTYLKIFLICTSPDTCYSKYSNYLSTDGSKCVSDCLSIGEFNPQTITDTSCTKCDDTQKIQYYSTQDNKTALKCILKETDTEDDFTYISNNIKVILNNIVDSYDVKKYVNNNLEALTKIILQTIKQGSDPKNMEKIKSNFADLFPKVLTFINKLTIDLKQIGSEKIGTQGFVIFGKAIQEGYKFKRAISIKSLVGQTTDLTEPIVDDSETEYLSIVSASKIDQNPYCTTSADCSNSPLIFIHSTQASSRRRHLIVQVPFEITFPAIDPKQNKLTACVGYDDSGVPTLIPQKSISSDNTEITCTIPIGIQSFSIVLDLKCKLLKKDLCKDAEENDDDESLNGGAIAGIVIGCIAFVGLIGIVIAYFQRIQMAKKLNINKYKLEAKQTKEYGQIIQTESIPNSEKKNYALN